MADPMLYEIEHGEIYAFADWNTNRPDIPRVAAGVYTIWEDDLLIYSGMAGASDRRGDRTAENLSRGEARRIGTEAVT